MDRDVVVRDVGEYGVVVDDVLAALDGRGFTVIELLGILDVCRTSLIESWLSEDD